MALRNLRAEKKHVGELSASEAENVDISQTSQACEKERTKKAHPHQTKSKKAQQYLNLLQSKFVDFMVDFLRVEDQFDQSFHTLSFARNDNTYLII